MHEQLHSDEQIDVFLTIEDDDILRIEIVSKDDQIDLSEEDEVVLFMDEEPVDLQVEDASHVVAELGPAAELEGESFGVMLRVYEFFEGWDFGPE